MQRLSRINLGLVRFDVESSATASLAAVAMGFDAHSSVAVRGRARLATTTLGHPGLSLASLGCGKLKIEKPVLNIANS